ncbi:hypothetical protein DDQ68_15880 [Hymenobacter nivis]|uniref:DUF2132 domain-containing protein n=1 Tax=Hymenobacter nivis TaxID=1850093 RepID=A0A2Z3GUZ8_9BACT|nr:hypothetical protein DDQ68_15880 [Hymenobacter nivis]
MGQGLAKNNASPGGLRARATRFVPTLSLFPLFFSAAVPLPADARDESGHLIRELHGVTLVVILEYLLAAYGWPGLDERLRINCFAVNPSIKSSLVFLRRTPWARTKVEDLYVRARTAEVLGRPRP